MQYGDEKVSEQTIWNFQGAANSASKNNMFEQLFLADNEEPT